MAATPATSEGGPWVGIEGGTSRRLHSDRGCMALKTPNARIASDAERDRLEECQHCTGDIDRSTGRGNRPGKSLEEIDVDEFDELVAEVNQR